MDKILRSCKHKILWAKSLLDNEGLLYLLKQIPETVFLKRDFYILVHEINGIDTIEVSLSKEWTIVNNDFRVLNLARENNPNLPAEFFFDRIDGCEQFYMMMVDSNGTTQPCAICWLYSNQYINRIIRLEPEEIEIKHVLTLEQFRNTGVFSNMMVHIVHDLPAKGYKRIFSVIEINNKPSLKVFQKFGFSIITKWSFRKFLGIQVSSLYKTVHHQ